MRKQMGVQDACKEDVGSGAAGAPRTSTAIQRTRIPSSPTLARRAARRRNTRQKSRPSRKTRNRCITVSTTAVGIPRGVCGRIQEQRLSHYAVSLTAKTKTALHLHATDFADAAALFFDWCSYDNAHGHEGNTGMPTCIATWTAASTATRRTGQRQCRAGSARN